MKRNAWRRSRLSAALFGTITLGAASGCTLLAQLDETFETKSDSGSIVIVEHDDGSAHSSGDDDQGDATISSKDGGPSGDATDASADAATDAFVPFVPMSGWQIDRSFASDGWLVFGEQVAQSTVPAMALRSDGSLLIAATYGLGLSIGVRAVDAAASESTMVTLRTTGVVNDLIANDEGYFVAAEGTVLDSNTDYSEPEVYSIAVLDDGGEQPTGALTEGPSQFNGTCTGRKISQVASGDVIEIGECTGIAGATGAGTIDNFVFADVGGDGGIVPLSKPAYSVGAGVGGIPDFLSSAALSTEGIWTVGCFGCASAGAISNGGAVGQFTLLAADGGIPSSGAFSLDGGVAGAGTWASDVAPLETSGALVVGIAGHALYAATVAGADGGVPPSGHAEPDASILDIPDASAPLVYEPAGHTRMATTAPHTHLMVAALSNEPALAAAVVDDNAIFSDDFSSTAHRIAGPFANATLAVGSLVAVPTSGLDEYVYVAVTVDTNATGRHVALLRLLHHVDVDAGVDASDSD